MPRPLLLSLSVLALAFVAGCGGDEDAHAQRAGGGGPRHGPGGGGPGGPPAHPATPVAVEKVRIGEAASYYTATATLEASSRAQLLSRATGVVREIVREEGDEVKAGQLLLRLEDDQARWRVKQAEANLEAARSDHARGVSMREGGLLSAEEFEIMQNTLSVREAELELVRLDYSYTRITSPFDGQVVRRHVDLGANITPGVPLFDVMNVDPLLARIHVPARRMGSVRVGQTMTMRLESIQADLLGRVSLISPIVDPATGTVKITAEITDYPPETRPGDFAQARIVTERHERAVLVPSRAVFEDQGTQVVYVVEDGVAVRRAVEPGFVDGDETEIVSGLAEDELIVVKGQRQLRDGGKVDVLEGPPDVLAALAASKELEGEASETEDAGDGGRDAS